MRNDEHILNYQELIDDYINVNDWRVKENSTVTTKLGQTYTAGFLEEHGQQIIWATPEEWVEYKTKK